jgi:hypothetical protein
VFAPATCARAFNRAKAQSRDPTIPSRKRVLPVKSKRGRTANPLDAENIFTFQLFAQFEKYFAK